MQFASIGFLAFVFQHAEQIVSFSLYVPADPALCTVQI